MRQAKPFPWLEEGAIVDADDDPDAAYPKRIRDTWAVYGKAEGHTCGTCAFCLRTGYRSSTYFKCEKNRISHGAATDWRAGWPACGLWEGGDGRESE